MYARSVSSHVLNIIFSKKNMAVTTPCLFIVRREKDGIVSSVNNIPWRNTNISSSLPVSPYSFGADEGDPWTIYWLHFQGKLRDQFLPSHPVPVTISPNEYSRLQDRLRLFEEIYSSFSMGYIKEYMIYSSMCLYNFLASFIYLEQFRHIMIPSQKEYPFTARVIHYMRENIQQNLTLKELASYFKYSPSHFSALFFGETGVSPMNYFIRLKIQKACEYIELTNMKLNEIATHLGFEDAAYFSRTFTKVMGCSPSVYRKKEMEI